ncbi:hypothetical protein DV515_00019237, partial [Chloebia gouldiae]
MARALLPVPGTARPRSLLGRGLRPAGRMPCPRSRLPALPQRGRQRRLPAPRLSGPTRAWAAPPAFLALRNGSLPVGWGTLGGRGGEAAAAGAAPAWARRLAPGLGRQQPAPGHHRLPPEWIWLSCYHGQAATIWSLGVLLYVMVCGSLPFLDDCDIVLGKLFFRQRVSPGQCPASRRRLCQAAVRNPARPSRGFSGPVPLPARAEPERLGRRLLPVTGAFRLLSPECQHLIRCCLAKHPADRPELEEISRHPCVWGRLPRRTEDPENKTTNSLGCVKAGPCQQLQLKRDIGGEKGDSGTLGSLKLVTVLGESPTHSSYISLSLTLGKPWLISRKKSAADPRIRSRISAHEWNRARLGQEGETEQSRGTLPLSILRLRTSRGGPGRRVLGERALGGGQGGPRPEEEIPAGGSGRAPFGGAAFPPPPPGVGPGPLPGTPSSGQGHGRREGPGREGHSCGDVPSSASPTPRPPLLPPPGPVSGRGGPREGAGADRVRRRELPPTAPPPSPDPSSGEAHPDPLPRTPSVMAGQPEPRQCRALCWTGMGRPAVRRGPRVETPARAGGAGLRPSGLYSPAPRAPRLRGKEESGNGEQQQGSRAADRRQAGRGRAVQVSRGGGWGESRLEDGKEGLKAGLGKKAEGVEGETGVEGERGEGARGRGTAREGGRGELGGRGMGWFGGSHTERQGANGSARPFPRFKSPTAPPRAPARAPFPAPLPGRKWRRIRARPARSGARSAVRRSGSGLLTAGRGPQLDGDRDVGPGPAGVCCGSRAEPLLPRRAGWGRDQGWDRARHRHGREEPLRDGRRRSGCDPGLGA